MIVKPATRIEDKQKIGSFVASAPDDLKRLGHIDFVPLHRGDADFFELAVSKFVRTTERSAMPAHNLNEPGRWDFFISHTQRNGDAVALATDLYHSLERRGHSVWFDVKMHDKSRAAMEEGVRGSRCVIAIITEGPTKNDNYFNRPYCLKELGWALESNVKIQPVVLGQDKKAIGTIRRYGVGADVLIMLGGLNEAVRDDDARAAKSYLAKSKASLDEVISIARGSGL